MRSVFTLLLLLTPLASLGGVPRDLGVPSYQTRGAADVLTLLEQSLVGDSTALSSQEERWSRFLQGSLLASQRVYPEAIAEFRATLRGDSSDVWVHLELARGYYAMGAIDSALVYAELAAAALPQMAEPRAMAGRCCMNLGRPADAIRWLEEARRLDPEDHWSLMNLLSIYENLGRFDEALALLEPVIPAEVATESLYSRRAELRQRGGNLEGAISDLAFVVSRDPQFPGVTAKFLDLVREMAEPDSALKWVEKVLRSRPQLSSVRRTAVAILAQSDHWQEAIPHLEYLKEQRPNDPRTALQLGLLYLRGDRVLEAEAEFQTSLRLGSKDPSPARWLWRVASQREDWKSALAWADTVLARDRSDVEGRWFRGLTLYHLEREDESIQALEALLTDVPQHRDACLLVSGVLLDRGESARPTEHLRRYLETDPTDSLIRFRLGIVLEQQGAVDSSIVEFERILSEEPDNHQALNYFGYMCIDRGIHLEESMERVKRALELFPESPAYQDSYGWGFYQLGESQAAIRYLEMATTGDSTNVVILKHLGKAYEQSGDLENARRTYIRALELDLKDAELPVWLDDIE